MVKQTPTPLFFTLPREIRDQIYQLVLPTGKEYHGKFDQPSGSYKFDVSLGKSMFLMSLLRVSRKFHEESKDFFYRSNEFHIELSLPILDTSWRSVQDLVIPLRNLRRIRNLQIIYDHNDIMERLNSRYGRDHKNTSGKIITEQLGNFFTQLGEETLQLRNLTIRIHCLHQHQLSRFLGVNQKMAIALANIPISNRLDIILFSNVAVKESAFKVLRRFIGPEAEWQTSGYSFTMCVQEQHIRTWFWPKDSKMVLPFTL